MNNSENNHSKLKKSSSTSSIYIKNSLLNIDAKSIIQSISLILHKQIKEDTKLNKTISETSDLFYFSEEKYIKENRYCFTDENIENIRKEPSIEDIQKFIYSYYNCTQISVECCIISFIYIDRIIALTGLSLQNTTWRPLVLIALMISQKVWDDMPYNNYDFALFFPFFDKMQTNTLEIKFLEMIQYNLHVSMSSFITFFFGLKYLTYGEPRKRALSNYEMLQLELNIKWKGKGFKKHIRAVSSDKYNISGQNQNYVIN